MCVNPLKEQILASSNDTQAALSHVLRDAHLCMRADLL